MNLWSNPLVGRQMRLNSSTLEHWHLYRSHREEVARLLDQTPRTAGAELCVLGAGNCNDLDLAPLTRRFARVHLVDLDHRAVAQAVKRQKSAHSEKIEIHGGVDVTGILKNLATWQRDHPRQESIGHCVREALAFVGLPFLGQFQVAVSTCLLTQLIDSVVSMTGFSSIPFALVEALRVRHVRLLAELLLPGGVGILVTDFAQAKGHTPQLPDSSPRGKSKPGHPASSFLGVSPEELYTLVTNDDILQGLAHNAQLTAPWRWQQNPRRTLLVSALRFQRPKERPSVLG